MQRHLLGSIILCSEIKAQSSNLTMHLSVMFTPDLEIDYEQTIGVLPLGRKTFNVTFAEEKLANNAVR